MGTDSAAVRVGKYQLVQRLGAGGMAELWLARHTEPGFEKIVAVKRVHPDHGGHAEFVAMFLDEARLGASLEHPNIVQVFDFGQADGTYYMAMEYLAGEDLGGLLKLARAANARIPPGRAAQLLAPAARALHHAHHYIDHAGRTHSVVHRDISPSNLMVTYDGVVKVLDFGIAKTAENASRTETGALKGKYPYMSPEQVRGLPLDGRSDVFALGAVLIELLVGKRVFSREDPLQILKALLEDPIPRARDFLPELPEDVDAVVARALARDRDARYPTAAALAEALEGLADSAPLGEWVRELAGADRVAQRSTFALPAEDPEPPSGPATVPARSKARAPGVYLERRVGRLVEVCFVGPVTMEMLDAHVTRMQQLLDGATERVVIAVDARQTGVLPPEVADAVVEMLRALPDEQERGAVLVRPGNLLKMQAQRIAAASQLSNGRASFTDEREALAYLDPALTEPERARLRQFLGAG